ncbi:MAG: hypothetical protein K0B10_10495 [Vicingaceae bacterium]|nr:hypothetical protein [Vicingaceae bacterium]
MFKLIKYGFIYLATIVVLMHNLVPHVHHSSHSDKEHQFIIENKTSDFIDFLAIIFHDFTDEGEMEEIVVRTHDDFHVFAQQLNFIHEAIVNFNLEKSTLIIIRTFLIPEQFFAVHSGVQSAWGIRPPPLA